MSEEDGMGEYHLCSLLSAWKSCTSEVKMLDMQSYHTFTDDYVVLIVDRDFFVWLNRQDPLKSIGVADFYFLSPVYFNV